MAPTLGYAAQSASDALALFTFERRALRDDDVALYILYCGECLSDLHQTHNDWDNSIYPVVPGREIIGRVTAVGGAVSGLAVGDLAAIGCMVDSCMECGECHADLEQYCAKGSTLTYDGKDRRDGALTFGGHSDHIVACDHFVIKLPDGLDPERAAPLLCAGITTWSPLRRWGVGPGTRVAVAGLGGLGHMGVKLAVGLGAEVTVLTTSPAKAADAIALGAHYVLITTNVAAMKGGRAASTWCSTRSRSRPYLRLLTTRGVHVIVGAIDMLPQIHSGMLLGGQKSLAGSAIGDIAETAELLAFCAEKNILPETEAIAFRSSITPTNGWNAAT